MKRSLLQTRLGALSHQQNESHLKAGNDLATQVTVEDESPKHSTIGDARETRYRRKSKRGEEKFEVYSLSTRFIWAGGRSLQRSQVCEQQHLDTWGEVGWGWKYVFCRR
jgi:hypothetical protein